MLQSSSLSGKISRRIWNGKSNSGEQKYACYKLKLASHVSLATLHGFIKINAKPSRIEVTS